MWGGLPTCGRLPIGLLIFENLSFGRTLPMFVSTFSRRRLPHFQNVGQPVFITWRLHGSLPANRKFPQVATSGEAFVAMDRILDSGCTGPLYLRMPDIATMVVEAIRYRDQRHYRLHAYVVMPNHVHLLITPLMEVSKVTQSLKRFTGLEGNRILRLIGPFWQRESYDRLVRDDVEFGKIVNYIQNNPVKAGLVSSPEEFPWAGGGPIGNRPQVGNLPYIGIR
jgi:REP element-mobilizing transposase RayT